MIEDKLGEAIEILKKRKLKVTPSRLEALRIIMESHEALSFPALEKMLPKLDRSTIFRTLSTFLKESIIHTVPDTEGKLKYAFSFQGATNCQEHIHFTCLACHNTCCLPGNEAPVIHLPEGYEYAYTNLLVHGVCNNCNQAKTVASQVR
jgi:Fur family ferric uptake transcriptional regulator